MKKTYDLSSLGGRISFIRGEMRQEDFASRMGITRQTVVRYESDERVPDAVFLNRLVSEFGVDARWLLTGEDAPAIKLTPREAALLDNYRHSPEQAKRNLETTSALFAERGDKKLKDAG